RGAGRRVDGQEIELALAGDAFAADRRRRLFLGIECAVVMALEVEEVAEVLQAVLGCEGPVNGDLEGLADPHVDVLGKGG
ncbi:hypothetical protein DF186_23385, partial [Enterococcus hirae]